MGSNILDPSLKEPRNLWLPGPPSKLFNHISVQCLIIPKRLGGSWSKAENRQEHGENVKTQMHAWDSNPGNVQLWGHSWNPSTSTSTDVAATLKMKTSVKCKGLKSDVSGPQQILSLLSYLLETIQSSSAVKQKIAIQFYFSSLSQTCVLPSETPGTGVAVSALWELSWASEATDVDRARQL